jgi:hypothetical protein
VYATNTSAVAWSRPPRPSPSSRKNPVGWRGAPSSAAGTPASTKASRAASVAATTAAFVRFEPRIPPATTAVSDRTAASARAIRAPIPDRPTALWRYPATPSAAVAADADFAPRNVHPAVKPRRGLR